MADQLRPHPDVQRVVVLRGALRAPGTQHAPTDPHPFAPAYDAVLLVVTPDVQTARLLLEAPEVRDVARAAGLAMTGREIRRIGGVDATRPGVFLLNFFSGPDVPATLNSWQYTAGWFQAETGLRTSEVIQPDGIGPYTLVNYARWDHFRDVIPSLILKPSFRTFVIACFRAGGVAPHPLLYVVDRPQDRAAHGHGVVVTLSHIIGWIFGPHRGHDSIRSAVYPRLHDDPGERSRSQ